MELIEKKCPNCGASLKFNEMDKNCTCDYCKSSFEIKRDDTKKEFQDQFDLKPLKVFSIFTIVSFFCIFIFSIFFIFVAFNMITNIFSNHFTNEIDKSNQLINSTGELNNSDINIIDSASKMLIKRNAEGVSNTNHSYTINGSIIKEKLYVASNDNSNYIVSIYKVVYNDFFHQENQFTVYIPIVFENITSDFLNSLHNGKVSAPEYYFDSDKSSYTYGYSSFDEAYNGVIKPLLNNYTVTEV